MLPWLTCSSALATEPVGPALQRTILFVDDHDVLYRSGTRRVVNRFARYAGNPVLQGTAPWENGDVAWTSIYRNPETGVYQMWYQAYPGKKAREKSQRSLVCYAESTDGIHFKKPELNLFSYNGVNSTNIVLVGSGGFSVRYCNSVVVDPTDDDRARRYKMAYFDFGEKDGVEFPGLHVAFSPDGIRWTKYTDKMPVQRMSYGEYNAPVPFQNEQGRDWRVPMSMSDAVDAFWDPRLRVFAIYGKSWIDGPSGGMHWKHAVARIESRDYINWSKPRLVMIPDESDPPWLEFHTAGVFFHKGCYFALVQILNRAAGGGAIDIELATSRDGLKWDRPFRKHLVLPRSEGSKFDSGAIYTNSTPVVLDKEIRFYYGAYSVGATSPYGEELISGIGFASIPLDRFAGIQPLPESKLIGVEEPLENTGQVTLDPVDRGEIAGGISVNADASDGAIRMEVSDESGRRVRGFSAEDSTPIRGDSLKHTVTWKNRTLSELPRGRYILRCQLEKATLYAVTLNPG